MKRILMVGPSRNMQGGVITVVNSYFDIGIDEKLNIKYVETLIDGNYLKKINQFFKATISILFSMKNTDIVHIHMASRGSFLRKGIVVLISKIFNKKIIIHLHGAEFMVFYNYECNKLIKRYIRYIFDKSDKVISLSESWKKDLTQIVNPEKIRVVPNGVLINNEDNEKDYKDKVVLFLGRLGERKGIFDLIDVIREIVNIHKDSMFIIAGDGEIEKVKNLCSNYNLNKNVRVLGWVDGEDKIELLKNATVYVLPSYNEGMPMSILEAMSFSIPVVSTYVGGIPEVINNGVDGLLIEPGNKESLKQKLLQLLNSESERELIGKKAKEKIDKKFNLVKISDKLLEIYNSI